jgi:hypothetical protein
VAEAVRVGLEVGGRADAPDVFAAADAGVEEVEGDEAGLTEVEHEEVGRSGGDRVGVEVDAVQPVAPEDEAEEEGVEEGVEGLAVGEEGLAGTGVEEGDKCGEAGSGAEAALEGAAGGALFAFRGIGAA